MIDDSDLTHVVERSLNVSWHPAVKGRKLPARGCAIWPSQLDGLSEAGYLPITLITINYGSVFKQPRRMDRMHGQHCWWWQSPDLYWNVSTELMSARILGLCTTEVCLFESTYNINQWHSAMLQGAQTSISSSSTRGECLEEPGIDNCNEESIGSVANISSVRVSSRGSTISFEVSRVNIWSIR